MSKEFYMIEVFDPGSYSVLLHKNGDVCKNGDKYSGLGCLVAVYRESNGSTNARYSACRYSNGFDKVDAEIDLLTPGKTIKKPLVGVVEKDFPEIINMLGF